MFLLTFLLVISLVLFLFWLFIFANDDHVLLRKKIAIESVFDVSFITVAVMMFAARITYVIFHFSPGFMNPLVFVAIPYFPGLLLPGGVAGVVLFLSFFLPFKKLPLSRFLDIFVLSFIGTLPFGFTLLGLLSLSQRQPYGESFIIAAIFAIIFFSLRRTFLHGKWKDGSIGLLLLVIFSLCMLGTHLGVLRGKLTYYFYYSDIVPILLGIISFGFLAKQERIIKRIVTFYTE